MPPKPNAPCHCGSKKKYKKCCRSSDNRSGSNTSHNNTFSTAAVGSATAAAGIVDHFQFINLAVDAPDNEPLMLDYGTMVGQQQIQGFQRPVFVQEPKNHLIPPSLPCFVVEMPTLNLLGASLDIFRYGGYAEATLLQVVLDASTTVRGDNIEARPEHFNGVPIEWMKHIIHHDLTRNHSNVPIWIGGSSNHGCEIFIYDDSSSPQQMVYNSHITANAQVDILQHRPTCMLLQPNPTAVPGTTEAMTKVIQWGRDGALMLANTKINQDGTTNKGTKATRNAKGNNILRAFFCAVDCHDLPACLTLLRAAETAAHQTGMLRQFADAMDRFNQIAVTRYYNHQSTNDGKLCVGFQQHPSPESDFAFISHQAGEAHEAAAALLNKTNADRKKGQLCQEEIDEMIRACCSYKFGAYLISQRHCGKTTHPKLRAVLWNALGVAIRRYAGTLVVEEDAATAAADPYFNMAERAYRWSASSLKIFLTQRHPTLNIDQHEISMLSESALINLKKCTEFRISGKKSNRKGTKKSMKVQRNESEDKSMAGNKMERACASCGLTAKEVEKEKLNRCGGCQIVYFCSLECQRKMWPKHKAVCRRTSASQSTEESKKTMKKNKKKKKKKKKEDT